jgi:hypothetical protein
LGGTRLILNRTSNRIGLRRGDTERSAVRFSLFEAEPLCEELKAFVDYIVENTSEAVEADSELRALKMVLAARDSYVVSSCP